MIPKRDVAKQVVSETPSAASAWADDDSRWQALVRRDRGADGLFVCAVRTTGVYCRPTCPARRPRRENVRFFATCDEAGRAGFRPCKRCRPNEAGLAERQQDAVARACRLIEAADDTPHLNDLAWAVDMSPSHFHRVF